MSEKYCLFVAICQVDMPGVVGGRKSPKLGRVTPIVDKNMFFISGTRIYLYGMLVKLIVLH
jgi:hypothetical protein